MYFSKETLIQLDIINGYLAGCKFILIACESTEVNGLI